MVVLKFYILQLLNNQPVLKKIKSSLQLGLNLHLISDGLASKFLGSYSNYIVCFFFMCIAIKSNKNDKEKLVKMKTIEKC